MSPDRPRPTPQQLRAAAGRAIEDVIAPGLKVLFVGINPGLYSAWAGQHFARPGNRFWKSLHLGGFTPRLLRPDEQRQLLAFGLGITNVVARASAAADELSRDELVAGGRILEDKARRFRPGVVVVLGLGAYRAAFDRPQAVIGRQQETTGGAVTWVLPNPSGLNAHYRLEDLGRQMAELKRFADGLPPGEASQA
jgi:TDG/mug DNA glycosylase family protein